LDIGQVEAARADAAEVRDDLDRRVLVEEARVREMEQEGRDASDPMLVQARGDLSSYRAQRSTVDAAIQQVDQVLSEVRNPTDPLSRLASQVSPLFPEPWRSPLLLGAAAGAALLRAAQLRRALTSVARGIDVAMREDPAFKEKFLEHANTFRTIQTATAQRVVDELRKPGIVRLPV
jgi:hypothetical protein